VSATGPTRGTLLPLFPDPDHLSDAQFDFEDGRVSDLRVSNAALIYAADSNSGPRDENHPQTIHSRSDGATLTFWPASPSSPPLEKGGSGGVKFAIWVRPDKSVRYIEKWDGAGECKARSFDDTTAAIRNSIGIEGGPAALKARAAALDWAIRSAGNEGRDTLIFWASGREANSAPLVEFTSEPPEEGARFAVWSLEAARQ